MKVAWRAALIAIVPVLAVSTLDAPDTESRNGTNATTLENVLPIVLDGDASAHPDLFGNDVNQAVARYRLDNAGDLYEVHSPETELPRLGSPKG